MNVYNVFKQNVTTIHNLTLYEPASNRIAWNHLPTPLQNELIQHGEEALSQCYPPLPMSLFMEFTRTGNRTHYEDSLFGRRIRLVQLVLAECVEYKGRFLDSIIDGIFLFCEETAWQLPAHNSYTRNTPQLILPDKNNPILDLFACETGGILATCLYLLKDCLNTVSPIICQTLETELNNRIIAPYLHKHFWWMGHGNEPMNNWTIWCTQNVLLTGFYTSQSQEVQRQLLEKACMSIDYFLKEYGDDGCCDEGAQYYRHAGLCLFHTLQIINDVTDDEFYCLWNDTKIKNIASYIECVYVGGPYYLNFADCSPKAGLAGTREYLFGKYTNQPELMALAARHIQQNTHWIPEASLMEHTLFYRLQEAYTLEEALKYPVPDINSIDCSVWKKQIQYKSVGIYGVADSYFTLAVKAGDNDDSHNHNDTGSFIVYANQKPFIIDVGVESYTRKTFSEHRYEIWTMQSAYHNLPTFDGIMQHEGGTYRATNVDVQITPQNFSIQMNLNDAYPEEADLASYQRTIRFRNNGVITLQDKVTYHSNYKPWTLSLMTYEKPHLQGSMIHIGSLGQIQFMQDVHCTIETIPITDPRLSQTWEHELYRILVEPTCDTLDYILSHR